MSATQDAASRPASADEYRVAIVVGTGIFATTLAQLEVLDLPFRQLLQTRFDASPQQTALFFAAAGAPWFLKPVAGLLSDSVPLFGTRRRHYLILCATLAAVFWLALGPLSHGYALLLAALVTMNAALVVASTVIGGLIAEKSREYGSAKRLVSAGIRRGLRAARWTAPPGLPACRSKRGVRRRRARIQCGPWWLLLAHRAAAAACGRRLPRG